MSEVPANPFAVPDGRRPDPASVLIPSSDPGGSPYGQPAYGTPTYGAPVDPPYGSYAPSPPYVSYPPPYSQYPPPYGHPGAAPQGSNGLAVASMVVGIVSLALCAFLVPAIVGLVLGVVALSQAKNGSSGGRGMAIAGVATSAVSLVLAVVFIIIGMTADTSTDDQYGYYTQGQTEQVADVPV